MNTPVMELLFDMLQTVSPSAFQVFFCVHGEIFKNSHIEEYLLTAAFVELSKYVCHIFTIQSTNIKYDIFHLSVTVPSRSNVTLEKLPFKNH